MDEQFQNAWEQLLQSVTIEQNVSALTLGAYLLLGGAMAIYIRFLYRKFGASTSDADSITRVFPLLTLVTIGVIAVVKTSMALSLGLMGALSIVRFRAAIKEPEELVYLFLCIGIGLALGAGQPLLAVVILIVATLFVVSLHLTGRNRREQNLLLTITGDSNRYFSENESSVLQVLTNIGSRFSLQRLDIENERGQVRVVLKEANPKETIQIVAKLRESLPGCEISYVNLNAIW